LRIGPWEGVLLGVNLGCAIVTNEDFTAYVCQSASTVGAAVWGENNTLHIFTVRK